MTKIILFPSSFLDRRKIDEDMAEEYNAVVYYENGSEKQYVSHLLQSFSRTIEDEKPAFSVVIPPRSRKLIRIIYEQREREENEEERSRCVQEMAEEFGLK